MSGPTEQEHAWSTVLEPGGGFTTVPVALAVSDAGLTGGLQVLTRHRRAVRRPNADDENLPVIFNDYMNALWGDPTTEKLLPLVDAAAAAGAEYFVVDCGWYTDEQNWWDLPGDWRESTRRFPGGLVEVFDHIRARGMVPGLWLEPEVVGVRSERARELPDEAFFCRDGVRVFENERYQLDFRHPAVLAHLDATIDRLVGEYGVGYLKFDHNINAAPGTDVDSDSPGDGLLGHVRAVSAWLDGLFARHPDLVVENCASGGLRVDYAQLSRRLVAAARPQPGLCAAIYQARQPAPAGRRRPAAARPLFRHRGNIARGGAAGAGRERAGDRADAGRRRIGRSRGPSRCRAHPRPCRLRPCLAAAGGERRHRGPVDHPRGGRFDAADAGGRRRDHGRSLRRRRAAA